MGQGMHVLPRESLQRLLDALHDAGYACLGPQVRDGTIVYDTLERVQALPFGWHERQARASDHLERDTIPSGLKTPVLQNPSASHPARRCGVRSATPIDQFASQRAYPLHVGESKGS
jgi:hypothetical protein